MGRGDGRFPLRYCEQSVPAVSILPQFRRFGKIRQVENQNKGNAILGKDDVRASIYK